ncbi:MAG: histidine kinase [Bacteroidia bacterium]|nr:histidine kinase [Bacteroidia bacterium]
MMDCSVGTLAMTKRLCLFIACLGLCLISLASNAGDRRMLSGSEIEYFIDESNSSTPTSLQSRNWATSDASIPNLGMQTSPVWVRFNVVNTTNDSSLSIHYPVANVSHLTFYDSVDFSNDHSKRTTGITYINEKTVRDLGYHFEMNILPGESRTAWFRMESDQQILLAFEFGQREKVVGKRHARNVLIYGMFVGIMLVMMLYNLVIFFVTRINLYLHYVVYVFFSLFGQSAIIGLYQNYFPILGIQYNRESLPMLVVFLALSGASFVYRFIDVRSYIPRMRWAFYLVYSSYVAVLIMTFSGYLQSAVFVLQINAFYCAVLILGCSAYIGFVKKNKSAKTVFIAWLVFMLGNIIYVFKDFGFLPFNWFTNNIIAIGTALETVLLSLALADLINRLKEERQLSLNRVLLEEQKNAMLNLRIKRSELASLQSQLNPNFVFNSLGSIQSDIVKEDLANAYSSIGKFAQLMRTGLEHSRANKTSISSEVLFLSNYLELERKRLLESFEFKIHVDPMIQKARVFIPTFLIQPICEDALRRGLADIKDGTLIIHFEPKPGKYIQCTISDNNPHQTITSFSDAGEQLAITRERILLFVEQGLDASIDLLSSPDLPGSKIQLILPTE